MRHPNEKITAGDIAAAIIFTAIAIAAALAAARPTTQPSWSVPAPTTWPAGIDPPSATYGWTARDALDGPAPVTQPTTAPATQPSTQPTVPIIIVTPPTTIPLEPILAITPPGTPDHPTLLPLPPGLTYTVHGPCIPPAYVKIDGTGSTLIVTATGPLADVFKLTNPGFTLTKFADIHGTGVLIDAYAGPWELAYNTISGIDRCTETNSTCSNYVSFHNRINARGVGHYWTGDNGVSADETITTGAEYAVRLEVKTIVNPGAQKTGTPIMMADGKSFARGNNIKILSLNCPTLPSQSKQNVGIRWGDNVIVGTGQATIDGQLMTFGGDSMYELRVGELATDLPAGYTGTCGSNLTISGITFMGVNPGNCPISMNLGFPANADGTPTIHITNCTFAPAICAAGVGPIGSSSPFTFANCTQHVAPGWSAVNPPPAGMKWCKPISATGVAKLGKDMGGNVVK